MVTLGDQFNRQVSPNYFSEIRGCAKYRETL